MKTSKTFDKYGCPLLGLFALAPLRFFAAILFLLPFAFYLFPSHAAQVLIPLQTCGISPATNRNIVLTPVQAMGSNSIPVMDRIQGATDAGGNWSPALLPGIYQADVRPAWGQVGVTEFYFYVDPSNAVQDAFTNLLTDTNNTWPPGQFAWTAQASDARYVLQSQFQNAITNVNAVTAAVATNAISVGNIAADALNEAYNLSWMTNTFLDWWSADMIPPTNSGSIITNWVGRLGNAVMGNVTYQAHAINGHPAVYFDGTGNNILTNSALCIGNLTNNGTIFFVFRQPQSLVQSGNNALLDIYMSNQLLRCYFSPAFNIGNAMEKPPAIHSYNGQTQSTSVDGANYTLSDDTRVFCVTWSQSELATFWDGKISQNLPALGYGGNNPWWPMGWDGVLTLGTLFNAPTLWPANAYLAEVGISTNTWSFQAIDQMSSYMLQKYELLRNTITFFGDSMIWGGVSSFGGNWSFILSTNFPNWSIDNQGVPGATSSQVLSNVLATAGTSCGTKKVGVIWCNGQNGGESIATITNNLITMAQCLSSNGWLTLLVDPPSNIYTDTNQGGAFKAAYQNFATNCWPLYFNGIIDLARDPYIGQSNDWQNLNYYPTAGGGEHWTNSGYMETAPCLIANIHAISDGYYFINNTNAPPPTRNQPWTAIDTRSPGSIFVNNNGIWQQK